MANERVTRCSTSSVIREMQTKTAMRHHHTPIRTAGIHNPDNTKCRQACAAPPPHASLGGTQDGTATLEDGLAVSYKAKHTLTTQSGSHSDPWKILPTVNGLTTVPTSSFSESGGHPLRGASAHSSHTGAASPPRRPGMGPESHPPHRGL